MKQQTKGGALHRLWQALPWLWMAAAYLFDLWYQLVPGKWIVDSDLASEMILSDLLQQRGQHHQPQLVLLHGIEGRKPAMVLPAGAAAFPG